MKKSLNSFHLKCIAVGMMIGGVYLQHMINFNIGYIVYLAAFPVVAFLLVEAAKKNSDRKRLLLRLLAAAAIVEIPMDVATFGISEWKNWGWNQNYFFTLAIGLCVIIATDALAKKYEAGTMANNLLTLGIYLLAAFAAILLRTEQGSVGVLSIICLYLFYGNNLFSLVSVAILYLLFMRGNGLEGISALSILLVWLYNGEQGRSNKVTRIVFYLAFPVMYCILGMIVKVM